MSSTKMISALVLSATLSLASSLLVTSSTTALARGNGGDGGSHESSHSGNNGHGDHNNGMSGMNNHHDKDRHASNGSGKSKGKDKGRHRTTDGSVLSGGKNTIKPIINKNPTGTPTEGAPVIHGGNPPRGTGTQAGTPVINGGNPPRGTGIPTAGGSNLPANTVTISNGTTNLTVANVGRGFTATRNNNGTITVSNGVPGHDVTVQGNSVTLTGGQLTYIQSAQGLKESLKEGGGFVLSASDPAAPPQTSTTIQQ